MFLSLSCVLLHVLGCGVDGLLSRYVSNSSRRCHTLEIHIFIRSSDAGGLGPHAEKPYLAKSPIM